MEGLDPHVGNNWIKNYMGMKKEYSVLKNNAVLKFAKSGNNAAVTLWMAET